MSATKATFRVLVPILKQGRTLQRGATFVASIEGMHVKRWMLQGRIEFAKVTTVVLNPAPKIEIEAMQKELLTMISHLGGMAQNLDEAGDWASDDKPEEAALSLEAVSSGAEDALQSLRRIALKCDEICSRKAVGA